MGTYQINYKWAMFNGYVSLPKNRIEKQNQYPSTKIGWSKNGGILAALKKTVSQQPPTMANRMAGHLEFQCPSKAVP